MRTLAITLAVAAACGSSRDAAAPALPDLSASLAPVRAAFDAHRGEVRFLTLLAPT